LTLQPAWLAILSLGLGTKPYPQDKGSSDIADQTMKMNSTFRKLKKKKKEAKQKPTEVSYSLIAKSLLDTVFLLADFCFYCSSLLFHYSFSTQI